MPPQGCGRGILHFHDASPSPSLVDPGTPPGGHSLPMPCLVTPVRGSRRPCHSLPASGSAGSWRLVSRPIYGHGTCNSQVHEARLLIRQRPAKLGRLGLAPRLSRPGQPHTRSHQHWLSGLCPRTLVPLRAQHKQGHGQRPEGWSGSPAPTAAPGQPARLPPPPANSLRRTGD